jgi:hypothetical protein
MDDHNQYGQRKTQGVRARLSASVASQVAEAALVLPLAFMMLLAIYWFGRAFNIYATINHATQQGVRAGVTQTCATCSNQHLTAAQGAAIITQAMQVSSVDPSQIQQWGTTTPTFCPSVGTLVGVCTIDATKITLCNNVQLSPAVTAGGPQVCGVTASFQYPYQFWLPFTSLNNQQIMLTVDVQMKGEY